MKHSLALSFALFTLLQCQTPVEENKVAVVRSFPLEQVRLLDGPFLQAQNLGEQTLLSYEPDRFLSRFRNEAGLKGKAEHYGGWEAETLAGHSLGHYLSACSQMYLSTGKDQYKQIVDYIVDELAICQEADGGGYIGAIPNGKRVFEEEIAHGIIDATSFNLNGIWAPYYSMHKVFAGLRDAYRLTGNERALEVESRFADWVDEITGDLTPAQIQEMLDCEHGGMNEIMVDLYVDTGEERYLEVAGRFYHEKVLSPLCAGEDILPGLHGNTQIPKLIGLARRYEVMEQRKDYQAASFFWETVVDHHSYVTGGHGNHEYFGQPDRLSRRLSDATTETCNVYNMLKLTDHLFTWEPSVTAVEFYERALINQILSSQHPENGRVLYNQSLEIGGSKQFQDPMAFTCCIGTGMENHSKHARAIYYHDPRSLYITQFIASELVWKDKGYTIRQTTQFPEEPQTTISFAASNPSRFEVLLRVPSWATGDVTLALNGENLDMELTPGEFVTLDRKWENGDELVFRFPYSLRLEVMPDDPNRAAVLYGPMVMAGVGEERADPNALDTDDQFVLLTDDKSPTTWLSTTKEPNEFEIALPGKPSMQVQPLYRTYDVPFTVYWDLYNATEWQAELARREGRQREREMIESITYDVFWPGDSLEEVAHQFTGDSIYVRHFKGRKARVAHRGGQFSFDLKVLADQANVLVVEYWGGFTGSKTFDILIEDQKVGTENISGMADGEFVFRRYTIPAGLVGAKEKVRVAFHPHKGSRAGPFFGARTLRL